MRIKQLFNQIAPKYDLLNTLVSLGMDRLWRQKLIKLIDSKTSLKILDVATGTGELALEICHQGPHQVVGIDLSEEMIKIGQQKIAMSEFSNRITLEVGDIHKTKFEANSFDLITISFGIRNFEQLEVAIQEMSRLLKPSAKFLILELTPPKNRVINFCYFIYVKLFLLPIAIAISRNRVAYQHLLQSIQTFPNREELLAKFKTVGFEALSFRSDLLGVTTIYQGFKK